MQSLPRISLLLLACLALLTGACPAAEPKVVDGNTTVATYTFNGARQAVQYQHILGEQMNNVRMAAAPTSDSLKREYLESLARMAAYRGIVCEQGVAKGLDQDATITQMLQPQLDDFLIRQLQYEVVRELPPPTDQAIETVYKADTTPFQQKESYSIQYTFAYFDDPKDTAAVAKARGQAEQAHARLKAGEEFTKVARELSFSPSGNQGEPVTYAPGTLNPQIEKLVEQLKDGELSGVLAVDSGFTVVRRLGHKPATTKPLDEVRNLIRGRLAKQEGAQAWESFYQEKLKAYQPTMNAVLVKDPGTSDSAEVFRFADQVITYGEIRAQMARLAALPEDKFAAQMNELFKNKMLLHAAREQGLDRSDEYQMHRTMLLRDQIFNREQSALMAELSAQETADAGDAQKYYDENKQSFLTERQTSLQVLRVLMLAEPAGESELMRKGTAFKTAQALRQRLTKGEPIEALMKEVNGEWDGNLELAPYGPRGRIIDMAVEKLKAGEISQPVEFKQGFYVIRVVEDVPPKPVTFEEVKPQIEHHLRNVKAQQRMETLREGALQQANFAQEPAAFDAALAAL